MRKILVVDDNPADLRLIEIMLAAASLSCECVKAGSLKEGIAAAAAERPDLALLDLGLPESSGIATLERFISATGLPVVVLSGNDDEEIALAAVKRGAQDYLNKGRVDEDLLARTIRYAIERAASARRLAESESRYRDLFDNANDMIMAVAPDGRFLYMNRSWCRTLGIEPGTRPEQKLDDCLHPHTLPRRDEIFFSFTPARPSARRELTLVNRAREAVIVEGEISARFDDHGSIESVRAIFRDITARKNAEREKERMQASLMSAQRMEAVGTLAGGVAHDFNNILTAIQGFADLGLKSLNDPEKLSRQLRSIKGACSRAAAIVKQLLLFSRKQVMEFKGVSLGDVVSGMKDILERLLGEGMELVLSVEQQVPPILGDSGSLEQVLMNLVVNGRDAMGVGGVIEVGVRTAVVDPVGAARYRNGRPGRFVEMWVRDNGCGMDAEVLRHAFEPFFTTKEPGRGTGLGLAVAFGIVEQHRGWIGIDSSPGEGTVVRAFFPVPGGVAETVSGEEDSPVAAEDGCGVRVLMVEDEDILRQVTCEVLARNGYEIEAVACAGDALAVIRGGDGWDVLFSDVVLPDMNGIKLAEQVSRIHPGIRIILTSGYADDRSRRALIEEKRFRFLPKPYSAGELLACVADCVREG